MEAPPWLPTAVAPPETQPFPIADPVPRLAPTSSGFSVDKLPEANIGEIRKTCQHYESKVSGEYSVPNSLAERYLVQLSRDVQRMLPGLDRNTKVAEIRFKQMKTTMADWQKEFGGDDGVALNPRQIKLAMAAQGKKIRALEAAAAQQGEVHAAEMQALGAQLAKYHGVARQSHEFQEGARRAEMEATVTQLRTEHAAELQRVRDECAVAVAAAHSHHHHHRPRSRTHSRAGTPPSSVNGAEEPSADAAAAGAAAEDDEDDELASVSVGSEEFEALQRQCDELRLELHECQLAAGRAEQQAAAALRAREAELGDQIRRATRAEARAAAALEEERKERKASEDGLAGQVERMQRRLRAVQSGEALEDVRAAERRADKMAQRVTELEVYVETLRLALGPHAPN